MAGVLQRLVKMHDYIVENGDPRSHPYPFVSSPLPMIATVLLYIAFTQNAPKFFQDKKPLPMKPLIMVYNFLMVLLASYMLKEFIMAAYIGSYSFWCQPYDRSFTPSSTRMAYACWVYYLSKTIELTDTVFLVVQKKGKLSFLHVFHHSSVILGTWLLVKYVPNGHGTFHAGCNCFIHTIMYSYYFLSCFPALKKYLWWKKYLTMMQMTQFIVVIIHIFIGLYNDCEYPRWTVSIAMFEGIALLALFANYYIQTHIMKKKGDSTKNMYKRE